MPKGKVRLEDRVAELESENQALNDKLDAISDLLVDDDEDETDEESEDDDQD